MRAAFRPYSSTPLFYPRIMAPLPNIQQTYLTILLNEIKTFMVINIKSVHCQRIV